MVTQAPKRSAVLAAIAFSLSCIGLIIFVWTQFGGTVPLAARGYQIRALFAETGLLVPGADVRIAGVDVGKVASVQARGVNSLVTLSIGSRYAPIPRDTRAILRQKTLLGEAYVAFSTGTGSGRKLPDGGTIPSSQIQQTQPLDKVLASFDTPTQHNLQALLNGTGTALAGRGQDLNDALGNLDPAVSELTAMVGVLNGQRHNLRSVINNGAVVLRTLGDRSADLGSLVTAGDQVLSSTASHARALSGTVDALPPFLTQLRTTLRTLDTTLGLARPSLAALRPAAPLLTPALRGVDRLAGPADAILRAAPPLLTDAKLALPDLARFAKALKPAIDVLLGAVRQISPVVGYVLAYRSDIVTAMATLAADLEATSSSTTGSGTAHYLRAITKIGRESVFGQSVREPSTRTNAYFSPGELADIAFGGLKAASCSQTGNSSQVPIPFTNVRCAVQPPVHWGHGIPTSYFRHVTEAPR